MKQLHIKIVLLLSCFCLLVSTANAKDPLAKASRTDKNGWIYIHLEGSPFEIGYQHGYLLSDEIDTMLQTMSYFLEHDTKRKWSFYRQCAKKFVWNKLDREYKDEINGIVAGLQAKQIHIDSLDIAAMNAYEELGNYSDLLKDKEKKDNTKRTIEHCSAFMATGSYTTDGKIVMGHNDWDVYIIGQHWNVIADIVPAKGNHILMDCAPGFIHSGDDFLITDNGILITETTISKFKGFDTSGIPEFQRARKAAQYSNSIDDVVKILRKGNNGGYANDWLIGDTKTNEVAKLELGLKNVKVWRSKDTAFIGANFPSDPKLIEEETTFEVNDSTASGNARKKRMSQLVLIDLKGKINAKKGKKIVSDHYDALNHCTANNRCVICGHHDEDAIDTPAYEPWGAVQGKITTADLAKHMKIWAHMGHPCGQDFIGADFYKKHPEFEWESRYLHDMISYPWTLFKAKK